MHAQLRSLSGAQWWWWGRKEGGLRCPNAPGSPHPISRGGGKLETPPRPAGTPPPVHAVVSNQVSFLCPLLRWQESRMPHEVAYFLAGVSFAQTRGKPHQHVPGSPRLTTTRLVTVRSCNGTEKDHFSPLRPLWSWKTDSHLQWPACPGDPLLRPFADSLSNGATDNGRDLLNDEKA